MNSASRFDSDGFTAVEGMCQRRSGGCTTAYSDAPARCAAADAIWSVPLSRLPPWNAISPNGERSSLISSTPGWARSSANMRLAAPRRVQAGDEHQQREHHHDQVAIVPEPVAGGERPVGHALDRRVVAVL